MDNSDTCLKIENLQIAIEKPNETLFPVDGLSLEIPEHTVVGLVGESGCGKSMTAMAIMGLLGKNRHISGGRILFRGEDISVRSEKQRQRLSGNSISVIFQDPMTSLNPTMRVGKQVEEVLLMHTTLGRKERKQKVIEMFAHVGIPDPEERYRFFPHQLSGGLRQRVMIAMAMVCNPGLLIADEPTTALDVTIEAQILKLMNQLRSQNQTSILMITHNLGIVSELCDFVNVMYLGEILEYTDTKALFEEPLHPYTKGLIGCMPRTDGRQSELKSIPGAVPKLSDIPKGCRMCGRCRQEMERCRREHPEMYEYRAGHYVRCFAYENTNGINGAARRISK